MLPLRTTTLSYRNDVQQLQALIEQSLAHQLSGGGSLLIDEIRQSYLQLPRTTIDSDQGRSSIEAKYALLDWHRRSVSHLIGGVEAAVDTTDRNEAVERLTALGTALDERQIERVFAACDPENEQRSAVARVLAQLLARCATPAVAARFFATRLSSLTAPPLGPTQSRLQRIKPYKKSRFDRMGWTDLAGAGDYTFRDTDVVHYRGLELRSGDILLADLARPSEGLFTSFAIPRTHFTHSALFFVARLGEERRRVPAVFEIHEKGVRIVPLNRFLSPDYVYYAEAHRPRIELPRAFGDRLSDEVTRCLRDELITYDFIGRPIPDDGRLPTDAPWATCSSLVALMWRRCGIAVALPESRTHTGGLQNFGDMDLDIRPTIFTPTDVLRSNDFDFVGYVDNNRFLANLAREVVIGFHDIPHTAGHLLSQHRLDPLRVPYYRAMSTAVRAGRNVPGVSLLAGIGRDDIPRSAPDGVLVVLVIGDLKIGSVSQTLMNDRRFRELAEQRGRSAFSLARLEQNADIRGRVADLLRDEGISAWFVGPR